jgi:hypothetical protein
MILRPLMERAAPAVQRLASSRKMADTNHIGKEFQTENTLFGPS